MGKWCSKESLNDSFIVPYQIQLYIISFIKLMVKCSLETIIPVIPLIFLNAKGIIGYNK